MLVLLRFLMLLVSETLLTTVSPTLFIHPGLRKMGIEHVLWELILLGLTHIVLKGKVAQTFTLVRYFAHSQEHVSTS